MKLQDLLTNRGKLRKYDDLKASLDFFKGLDPNLPINFSSDTVGDKVNGVSPFVLEVIINALESEIAKLDEE